jgi:hypothetical protein
MGADPRRRRLSNQSVGAARTGRNVARQLDVGRRPFPAWARVSNDLTVARKKQGIPNLLTQVDPPLTNGTETLCM